MNPFHRDALNYADILNMKTGDIFYKNYNHLCLSKGPFYFAYIDYTSYKEGPVIVYSYYGKFSDKYHMEHTFLSDCGVTPYLNGFNKDNYLTREKQYFNK